MSKRNYFTSDQTQLWLMADPPVPINAQVRDMRRDYDELGNPKPRWRLELKTPQPESVKLLRDFRAGCKLAIAHFEVFAFRKTFAASSVIVWLNDCCPVDAEIDDVVTYGDVYPITYRLTITCEVELLPEPAE